MSKEKKIHERNPDTGEIKSRPIMSMDELKVRPARGGIWQNNQRIERETMLDEIWAAPKVNHEGHWYVRMTDIVKILES